MRTAVHITTFLLILIIISCNKKDEDITDYRQGTGRCRLKSFTIDYPEPGLASRTTYLHYDEQNRLQRVSYDPNATKGHYQFVYGADYFLRRQIAANGQRDLTGDSITFDIAGRITGIYKVVYWPGTSEVNSYEHLIYNSAGQHVTTLNSTNSHTVSFFWQGGDLVRDTSGGHACEYTYHNDRPSQYASSEARSQFSYYGKVVDGTSHLLKSVSRDGRTSSYIYGFDADGKIIADTVIGPMGPERFDTYEYECL